MSVKSVHPLYSTMEAKWRRGADSYDGEDAIKAASTAYLPATGGQKLDGQGTGGTEGEADYDAYLMRAVYPSIYQDAVEAAIGIMHREPPTIELPQVLESLMEDATLLNEPLPMLLRRINAQQLITGRVGLLGDVQKKDGVDKPLVALYTALAIVNWNDASEDEDEASKLNMVVLDESTYMLNENFVWIHKPQFRVLGFTDNDGKISSSGTYGSALLGEGGDIASAVFTKPGIMGATLDAIPFSFVNSKDTSSSPDNPPLDGLAKICLAIYRGEADYRLNLFMQSQDTLVRIGGAADPDESVRVGAGSRIDVPLGGDAKYIGVTSVGLTEQRESLQNDYGRAVQKSGQLIDTTSRAKESGDALRIRVAAQTATLPQIAKTGAAALQQVLRALARWYGANEEEVIVTPNLNFTEGDLNGKTLLEIMQAKALGAPIAEKSVHAWMQDQGFTKETYDDEIAMLDEEEPLPGTDIISPVDKGAEGEK